MKRVSLLLVLGLLVGCQNLTLKSAADAVVDACEELDTAEATAELVGEGEDVVKKARLACAVVELNR